MQIKRTHCVLLIPMLFAAGCVTVPPHGGFADVEQAVAERTGNRIYWNQGTAADQAVDAQVRAMLEKELGADEAVQVALLNNRNLQATYEDLGIAQADLVQAGLLNNPIFEFDPRWPNKSGLRFNYEATVIVDFIDILFRPLRKKVAEAQFEAAKRRVGAEVVNTASDVRAAFYRLQAAEQLVEMRRTVARATEISADAARRLREAGNITPLALLNEQGLHEKAKVDLADAEADALDHREELSVLMGLWGPAATTWKIGARLPDLPATEVDLPGLEALAVGQRLDLQAAAGEIQALGQTLNLTGFTRFPFSTGVHAERDADPGGPVSIGPHLEGEIPLFDQGRAKVAGAQAMLRQGLQRYAALAVQVRGEVRRARNRLVAQRAKADYYRRVLIPLRQRATAQTQLEYNGMQIGIFQLLTAKQEEINAGGEYIEALREYWLARTDLEKAVGGRLKGGSDERPSTMPADPAMPTAPQAPHHHH